ncbi:enoyl-CoA hydratase [Halobacteriales archaeon QH_7_69_31]|nr:MAG: enoyl-CoA hydratase [Halobacteriales archaeon QH_7_69_31]
MSDPVILEVEDGIATLTLNRPDDRNALSAEMSGAILDAIDELEGTDDARCLVVQGTEGTFCAGGDVNAMIELMSGAAELHEAVERIQHETHRAIRRVAEFHLPTVAKVDGVAFRQVGLGIDSGTSYLLPRQVGLSTAKELVFTGEMLDAEAAADLGLFNHVYAEDFDEQCDEFIEQIAEGPTVALRHSKKLLEQGVTAGLKEALDNEAAAQAAVFETHDHEEGATAFMEGRDPEFEGR